MDFQKLVDAARHGEGAIIDCRDCRWCANALGFSLDTAREWDICSNPAVRQIDSEYRKSKGDSPFNDDSLYCRTERQNLERFTSCGVMARFFEPKPARKPWYVRIFSRSR